MNESQLKDPLGVEVALRLRLACEAHEPNIKMHLNRVRDYACRIAELLVLPRAQIECLAHAVPLHDIGKIGISTELLNKPSRLTDEEMDVIRGHTVIGHKILSGSPSPILQCAARIALSHHEAWNGEGYPQGLEGTRIPLEARITAIADVYDALLSQRTYKGAWEKSAALSEMRRLRGIKFDPEILDIFLDEIEQPHAVGESRAGSPL